MIEAIQSGLVEVFDQFRELRKLLASVEGGPTTSRIPDSVGPVSVPPPDDSSIRSASASTVELTRGTEPTTSPSTEVPPAAATDGNHLITTSPVEIKATTSRILDPIAREVSGSNLPAHVLLEYMLKAKEYLGAKIRIDDRVSADMDLVIRFLRSRGNGGLTEDERKNILLRIKRWKEYISGSDR
ncbi:MAG: hypothetical protein QXS20_08375 [Candidatus Thorarchaeota archaeon]